MRNIRGIDAGRDRRLHHFHQRNRCQNRRSIVAGCRVCSCTGIRPFRHTADIVRVIHRNRHDNRLYHRRRAIEGCIGSCPISDNGANRRYNFSGGKCGRVHRIRPHNRFLSRSTTISGCIDRFYLSLRRLRCAPRALLTNTLLKYIIRKLLNI